VQNYRSIWNGASELYCILKPSLAAISRWSRCASDASISPDKGDLAVATSESPKRASLRFRSFRTFSTFNIDPLALPALKKLSVRGFPDAALFFCQEHGTKEENDRLLWSNLERVAQERLRVLTRAESSLNVSREKKGDTQGPSGKETRRSRPRILAETNHCFSTTPSAVEQYPQGRR
jgi:hypothetical protein